MPDKREITEAEFLQAESDIKKITRFLSDLRHSNHSARPFTIQTMLNELKSTKTILKMILKQED